jgi:hypothetical protein
LQEAGIDSGEVDFRQLPANSINLILSVWQYLSNTKSETQDSSWRELGEGDIIWGLLAIMRPRTIRDTSLIVLWFGTIVYGNKLHVLLSRRKTNT